MIILYVTGKQFGKNNITYKAVDKTNGETINEGKCGTFGFISDLYSSLQNEYGKESVRQLTR
jgi:hypothetical protein